MRSVPERSTAIGLPTVITSIRDRGDGGDSKVGKTNDPAERPPSLLGAGFPVRGSIHVVICLMAAFVFRVTARWEPEKKIRYFF